MLVSFHENEDGSLLTDNYCKVLKEVKFKAFALPYLLVLIVYIYLIFLTSQTSYEEVSSENEWLGF